MGGNSILIKKKKKKFIKQKKSRKHIGGNFINSVFMDRFINIAWIFGKKYKEYEDF